MSTAAEEPQHSPEKQGWVDEDYYDLNPWYNEPERKPIFSLGKPMPHTCRSFQRKKKKQPKRESDLEKGKGHRVCDAYNEGTLKEKSASTRGSTRGGRTPSKRTNTGHGQQASKKHNEAGQPVYDYQPGERDHRPSGYSDREGGGNWEHEGAGHEGDGWEEGEKYKVDGEPIGQTEDDEAEKGEKSPDEVRNWWARLRAKYPEPLAEFLCVSHFV